MKTINDLFNLAILQVELNKSKLVEYHIVIDTSFNWVTLKETYTDESGNVVRNSITGHMSFDTPEKMQECYWTIYNKVRTK